MRNIVLTGFMGTGKTSVGKILATRLGWAFIDMDEEIEKEEAMSITDIFARFGEQRFRDIETAMAEKLSSLSDVVLSTGGGAVLREQNMAYLRRKGVIVCLTASPQTIYGRTRDDGNRPLLKTPDPLKKITELLDFRTPFYEKADLVIPTDGLAPEEIAARIEDFMGSSSSGGATASGGEK